MLQPVLVASVNDGEDGVIDIFLNAVVNAARAVGGMRPVIVNAKASANVNELNVESHLVKLHVELCGLLQGYLDTSYLCHLASNVIMHEL